MWLWVETLGVAVLVAACGWLGRWWGRLPSRWWIAGYAVPLAVILPISLARRLQGLQMVPPFTWLMTGRLEFVIQAAAVAMLVLCLAAKIQARRMRLLLWLLMLIGVGGAIVPAFLLPAAYQYRHARLVNQYGTDGICRQFSAYACGPAAAVIALERLGLASSEGELAILARTSPLSGTDESTLALALSRRYASAGLVARLERVGDLEALSRADGAIVAIRFGTWVDHYVAILEVSPESVTVGDPLAGKATYSRAAFLATCRPVAVTLRRSSVAGGR